MSTYSDEYDVIVIGSGMGGMTTAAALSRFDHKVLLLEQAQTIGGLTHSFTRNGFSWDVGLHYCGTFGPDQFAGRILDWLSDGSIEFRSIGTVYDTLHFPDDIEIPVGRPADAYKMELKDRFPDNAAGIDAYFDALMAAEEAARMVGSERAMPDQFRSAHHWWNRRKIERWCGRTTSDVIKNLITEPRLAAILSAQWGTYGGRPKEASFGVHALVMGHYLEGAAYPLGGAATIAKGLVPVIEASGGSARAGTPVSELIIEDGKAVGVLTGKGQKFRSGSIVSAIGAGETVKHLLPKDLRQEAWAKEISTFKPSVCHFGVYIGFEGDIAKYGATRSNAWFFETWDTNEGIWTGAANDPIQTMFVSFPSLKDPLHDPGPAKRHTGDIMVLADWSVVADFADGVAAERVSEWSELKDRIEAQMLAFFARKFPALAPLITYRELGTPLATAAFTGHSNGGFYGIEASPRRMLSEAFNARTPIPGLFLSGQDVMGPGIAGALAGGMLGAAAIDPRVFLKLR